MNEVLDYIIECVILGTICALSCMIFLGTSAHSIFLQIFIVSLLKITNDTLWDKFPWSEST